MSCSNIPTKILLRLDKDDQFVSFDFFKLACKCSNSSKENYFNCFKGKTLNEIFEISFSRARENLKIETEEDDFIFKLEHDALKAAIANYLGIENETVDKDRCHLLSINYDSEGTAISMEILPPKA